MKGRQLLIHCLRNHRTNDEYEKITGRKAPFDLTYEPITRDIAGKTVDIIPVNVLCYQPDFDRYEFFRMGVAKAPITNKDKTKFKFVDSLGRISYYLDKPENISPNYSFDSTTARTLFYGEDIYHTFMQMLFKYSYASDEADWMKDLASNSAGIDTLLQGDFTGLRGLITYARDNDHSVGVLFTVRVREKDGKTQYVQNIESYNQELIYLTNTVDGEHTIPSSAHHALIKYEERQQETGYSVTKNLYSRGKIKAFNKDDFSDQIEERTSPDDAMEMEYSETSGSLLDEDLM